MALGGRWRNDVIYENDSGTNCLLSAGWIWLCMPAGGGAQPKGINTDRQTGGCGAKYYGASSNGGCPLRNGGLPDRMQCKKWQNMDLPYSRRLIGGLVIAVSVLST